METLYVVLKLKTGTRKDFSLVPIKTRGAKIILSINKLNDAALLRIIGTS